MLGCQDFCGYYDWTFHFVRRSWGQEAVRQLWAEAIGGDSQQHYAQSALRRPARPLPAVDQDRRRGIVRLDIHAR